MTTKHTPGPWEWIGDNLEAGSDDVLRVGDDGKEYGMHSAVLFESEDPEQAAANRALIAASPDLLAALTLMTNEMRGLGLVSPYAQRVVSQAAAAIAKATGAA